MRDRTDAPATDVAASMEDSALRIPYSVPGGVLGVDLGGTNARAAAIAPEEGKILARRQRPSRAAEGLEAVVAGLVEAVTEAAAAADLPGAAPVGVAVPGPVNPTTGVVGLAPNLAGWRDVPIRDLLAERLGRPVAV